MHDACAGNSGTISVTCASPRYLYCGSPLLRKPARKRGRYIQRCELRPCLRAGFRIRKFMKATWNGSTLAESDNTIVVEGNHYFPKDSINTEYFQPSETHTVCPWK